MIIRKLLAILTMLPLLIFTTSCEEEGDPVIEAVEEAESILRNNQWQLDEYIVAIKNEDVPPPFLAGVSDGLLQTGTYNGAQIFGDLDDVGSFNIRFTNTNTILVDTAGTGEFAENGTYKIFGMEDIRIGIGDETKLRYQYVYLAPDKTMLFDADENTAGLMIDAYNGLITRLVVNETPNKIGDAVAKLLFENEKVQEALNNFLVDLISGKLDFLNNIDPEAQADSIATTIFQAIEQVDWQKVLSDTIESELEKITDIDAQVVSQQIAEEVVAVIQTTFSVEAIFDFILPFFEKLDEIPSQELAERVATVTVALILDFFDQDKLEEIIFPIWEKFTMLDDATVAQVSDSLATLVEKNRINQDSLSAKFLPATQKIATTPIGQLDDLAIEIVDSLEVQINRINALFPDLGLAPDYQAIESAITAALIALKPVINSIGAEEAADQIADLIIESFLDHETLKNAFINATNFLQSIDPATASTRISEWLVNIIGEAEQSLINFLSNKLSPIAADFDPQFSAFKIASALNNFIETTITEEFIFNLVFPKIEMLTEINAEEAADYLTDLILGSNLINDNITQENIEAALVPVLMNLKNTDTREAAERIIEAILNSDFVKDGLTQERVSRIIGYVLYNALWDRFKVLNNFESISIALSHD